MLKVHSYPSVMILLGDKYSLNIKYGIDCHVEYIYNDNYYQ